MASARANSIRFRSGTFKLSAGTRARWASPTKSRTSSACRRAWASSRAPPRAPKSAPTITFWRTVSLRNGLTTWNVRLIPRRPIS